MIWPDIVVAVLFAGLIITALQKQKWFKGIIAGVVTWIPYCVGAFVGDLISRKLYPAV